MSDWVTSSIANITIGASGIFTGILIARTLGPAGRGALVASMLWVNLIVTAGAVLNLQSATYFCRKALTSEARAEYFGVCLILAIALSLLLLLGSWPVVAIALAGAEPDTRFAARVYSLIVPLTVFQGFWGAVLLANDRLAAFWSTRLIGTLLYLVGLTTIVALGSLTVLRAIVAVLLSQAAATTAMSVLVLRHMRSLRPRWNSALCRQIVVFGAKTNLVGIPQNMRLDQLVMSVWLSSTVLGLYATASTWSSTLGLLAGGASTLVLSRSSSTSRDDSAAVGLLLVQFRRLMLVFAVLGAAAAVAAPIGIPLLFGRAFAPSVVPAVILCAAAVLLNMNAVLHELARGLGEPAVGIRAELMGLLVTALVLAGLLRSFGGLGAAVACVLGYGTVLTTLIALLRWRLAFSARMMLVPRAGDVRSIVRQLQPLLRFRVPPSSPND